MTSGLKSITWSPWSQPSPIDNLWLCVICAIGFPGHTYIYFSLLWRPIVKVGKKTERWSRMTANTFFQNKIVNLWQLMDKLSSSSQVRRWKFVDQTTKRLQILVHTGCCGWVVWLGSYSGCDGLPPGSLMTVHESRLSPRRNNTCITMPPSSTGCTHTGPG